MRKEKGQIFTPPGVCRLMAGLFTRVPERFRILDAGARVVWLASAICERLLTLHSPRKIEMHLRLERSRCTFTKEDTPDAPDQTIRLLRITSAYQRLLSFGVRCPVPNTTWTMPNRFSYPSAHSKLSSSDQRK